MARPKHDYHLVDPSPWPALGALAAFFLTAGLIVFMHPKAFLPESLLDLSPFAFYPGIALMLITMFLWWRDVIAEAHNGDHKPVVQLGLRYGMVLFIASEVMFFVAFFWAFFNAALAPQPATGGVWPPEGITTLDAFDVPFMNTVILLLSGVTVTWAHQAVIDNNRRDLVNALGITIILGFVFTVLQAYEYAHAEFSFTQGIYASTFYMATGFHGAHVLIGTLFLCVCWFRAKNGDFKPEHHFGLEAAAWYWHFVDVVWLFLFINVYWWGG